MQIIKTRDYDHMSTEAAEQIASQVISNPKSVLGLATGSSPIGTYQALIALYQKGELDFSSIKTFNLDEYVGLPATNDQSYRYFMEENFFNKINIDEQNINFLSGMDANPEEECQRYEGMITQLGGIDLQLLGLGHNGHIAFNEPSNHFERETFLVELTQSTIDANKRFFASEEEVPKRALTMGIGTIMKARKIVVVVSGQDKAKIAQAAIQGPITPQVPASILQLHNDVVFIGDESALSLVS